MNAPHEGYYIGLMTGTSMDAVDTALVEISSRNKTRLLASHDYPLPDSLRNKIIGVSGTQSDSLHDVASLDHELAETYAECILSLLSQTKIKTSEIRAIGSHGQTIRHCPDCEPAYTVQIGNADRLVELTGITTVNNFRQRDVAAGGQGAPLAPRFHHHLFATPDKTVVGVNLGGIANISILHADGGITGFDTGPANNLMDQWIERHQGNRYDKDGLWAKTGQINSGLLKHLLSEPWLSREPPKSTGPELFNLLWLDQHLSEPDINPADVQRSLCEFTAISLTDAISSHAPDCEEIVVCGGGAYNPFLIERIKHLLPNINLISSESYGIAPEWIEACMFAWLAYRTMSSLPGNVPAVTGARHEAILGAIHPA